MSNRTAASSERSHLALVPRTSRILDATAASPDSWDDRRSSIRRTLSELSWLTQVRLKYGPTVSLIDLSAGGAQIEATALSASARLDGCRANCRRVRNLRRAVAGASLTSVQDSAVGGHVPNSTRVQTPLRSPRLARGREIRSGPQSRPRARQAQRRTATPGRIDDVAHGDKTGAALTGVGRGAVAAALALMESPSGRRASGTFSREMGRLFRVVTCGPFQREPLLTRSSIRWSRACDVPCRQKSSAW